MCKNKQKNFKFKICAKNLENLNKIVTDFVNQYCTGSREIDLSNEGVSIPFVEQGFVLETNLLSCNVFITVYLIKDDSKKECSMQVYAIAPNLNRGQNSIQDIVDDIFDEFVSEIQEIANCLDINITIKRKFYSLLRESQITYSKL